MNSSGLPPQYPGRGDNRNPWPQPIHQAPASSPFGNPPGGPPVPPSSGKSVWIILGLIASVMFVGCLGLVGLGYFAAVRFVDADAPQRLEPRTDGFADDLERFNQRLGAYVERAEATADAAAADPLAADDQQAVRDEIEQWLRNAARAHHEDYTPIPFSSSMFFEACRSSPFVTSMPLAGRLAMKVMVEDDVPDPDLEQSLTIVGIDVDEERSLATIHAITYGDFTTPTPIQLFVVKEDGEWKLYDWQRLEYGRRISDEYGAYFSNLFHPHNEGYYDVVVELAEVFGDIDGEMTERTRTRLRALERRRMRDEDRPVAMLRIAWTWQALDEHEEALRVLAKIREPQMAVGVLPARVLSLMSLMRFDEAEKELEKLAAVGPHHPWLYEARARLLSQRGEKAAAVRLRLAALRLCPDWDGPRTSAMYDAEPDQVGEIAELALRGDSPAGELIDLLENWMYQPPMVGAFSRWAEQHAQLPGLVSLAHGIAAYAIDDYEEADSQLRTARDDGAVEIAEAAAKWLRTSRLEAGMIDRWLADSDDKVRDLETLADELITGYTDVDRRPWEEAAARIEPSADAYPLVQLISGLLLRDDPDPEKAKALLEAFLDRADSLPPRAADSDLLLDDDDEIVDRDELIRLVREQRRNLMLRLGQWPEALEEIGDDPEDSASVVNYVAATRDAAQIERLIDRLQGRKDPRSEAQIARLRSVLAWLDGRPEEADRLRQSEIERLESFEADSWRTVEAAQRRGGGIVWSRLENRPLPQDLHFDEVVEGMRRMAFALLDEEMLDRAETLAPDAPDSNRRWSYMHYQADQTDLVLARLAERRGQPEAAERLLRRRVQRNSQSNDFDAAEQALDLVEFLCRTGSIDEAKAFIADFSADDDEEEVGDADADDKLLMAATVLAAEKQWDELSETLDRIDRHEVGSWLTRESNRPLLTDDSEGVRRLLRRHHPAVQSYYSYNTAHILLSDTIEADRRQVAERLSEALGSRVTLEEVRHEGDGEVAFAWTVAIDQRPADYLIYFRSGTLQPGREPAPPPVIDTLNRCQSLLHVASIDRESGTLPEMWDIAAALTQISPWNDQAIGLSIVSHIPLFWVDDPTTPLSERLQREDRLPIDHLTWGGLYLGYRPPAESPEEPRRLSGVARNARWEQRIETDGLPLTAAIRLQNGAVVEKIPCEIIELDEREVTATLQENSSLRPWLQRGLTIRTPLTELDDPPPASNHTLYP